MDTNVSKRLKYKDKKGKKYGIIRKRRRRRMFFSNILFAMLYTVIFAIFGVALIVSLCTIQNGEQVTSCFGWSIKIVATGSMSPSILPGDVVIIHTQESYEVGDVITFLSEKKEIDTYTHRIVAAVGVDGTFQTQGDANNSPDEELAYPESIIGKAIYLIPQGGRVVQTIQKIPVWVQVAFLIGAGVFVLVLQIKERINYKEKLTPEELVMEEAYEEYQKLKKFNRKIKKVLKVKFEVNDANDE